MKISITKSLYLEPKVRFEDRLITSKKSSSITLLPSLHPPPPPGGGRFFYCVDSLILRVRKSKLAEKSLASFLIRILNLPRKKNISLFSEGMLSLLGTIRIDIGLGRLHGCGSYYGKS